MRKTLVLSAIGAVVFLIGSTHDGSTFAQTVPYNTALFSAQYPSGAKIELKNDSDPDGSVSHFYRGRLPNHSWADVIITDFRGPVLDTHHTEVLFSKSSIGDFAPNFHADPITKTTLAGLRGYKQTIRGQIYDTDLPLVVHWRLAISRNRTRVWIVRTMSPSDQDLSESDCERFFNSLKIK